MVRPGCRAAGLGFLLGFAAVAIGEEPAAAPQGAPYDLVALAKAASSDRAQRVHDLLHGDVDARVAAAAACAGEPYLWRAEFEALLRASSTVESPLFERVAVRALARAAPGWKEALAAIETLEADPARSKRLRAELNDARQALREARRREEIRAELVTAFGRRISVHRALEWVKSVDGEPDTRMFMEFFRDGARWGARMWQPDRGSLLLAVAGFTGSAIRYGSLEEEGGLLTQRMDIPTERVLGIHDAARRLSGRSDEVGRPPSGPVCFGCDVRPIHEEPTRFTLGVNLRTGTLGAGPAPEWLRASEFHLADARVERDERTVTWTRAGEVRTFDVTDGMPQAWSLTRERARLVARTTAPSWDLEEWRRALGRVDEWWGDARHRGAWLETFAQISADIAVQIARMDLAVEKDWATRTDAVMRAVADVFCATEAIRAKSRHAAIAAATAHSLSEAAVESAVDTFFADVVRPGLTDEAPGELATDGRRQVSGDHAPAVRARLLGAIRTALSDQVRAAWPAK
jgi:hypothetical protein